LKLTKARLKQIIKEEYKLLIKEQQWRKRRPAAPVRVPPYDAEKERHLQQWKKCSKKLNIQFQKEREQSFYDNPGQSFMEFYQWLELKAYKKQFPTMEVIKNPSPGVDWTCEESAS